MFLLDKLKSLFTGASDAAPETPEPEIKEPEETRDLSTMKVVELRDMAK